MEESNRKIQVDGKTYTTHLKRVGDRVNVTINQRTYVIIFPENIDYKFPFTVWVDNEPYKLQLMKEDGSLVKINGKIHEVKVLKESTPIIPRKEYQTHKQIEPYKPAPEKLLSDKNVVTAPMAGRVILYKKQVGDEVKTGETVY